MDGKELNVIKEHILREQLLRKFLETQFKEFQRDTIRRMCNLSTMGEKIREMEHKLEIGQKILYYKVGSIVFLLTLILTMAINYYINFI